MIGGKNEKLQGCNKKKYEKQRVRHLKQFFINFMSCNNNKPLLPSSSPDIGKYLSETGNRN